ncbi:MAG: DEAD/DEAH box helicase family protein [Candidatus Nomurabacteria bacterium]|jgi:type III restriction enzyme|nr:DEAD/DEAH box helicase family protein [Candidatus Nomurabacteria bacterium]
MALSKDFPTSPHAILDPSVRWVPGEETSPRDRFNLLPPLVSVLREKVKTWRDNDYAGASDTSRALLKFWFETEHIVERGDNTFEFRYYFAQREAVETIIYLHDIARAMTPYDLMAFDGSGELTRNMFPEDWRRYVVKMATGAGKTKVLALALVWAFFHKTYEEDSDLARNFLVIAPNIIVLDRIRKDFEGLKMFFEDPMLPDNGFMERDWRADFQLTLHIQDDVKLTHKTGNIFLTNIHRVYDRIDKTPSASDENTMGFFLGERPVASTNDSKVDLGDIVRDINELIVLNDEAHHIHDERMSWFKSIEDIHNRLKMKGDKLALQIDVSATPKKDNGAVFPQVVSDYPLVEAIAQNIVKHPVLPDEASRAMLHETQSAKFTEKYADYINLGVTEWKKAYNELIKDNKKAVLFVMTDDTKNGDDVAQYLEATYPELRDAVLTIHTNKSGEISETTSGKSKEELELLRKQANEIDSLASPYKAVVSVLMLKEGWDVQNVTTIVGLRAYSSKAKILPEQTLGRGLRRMFRGQDSVAEEVSIIGTDAFIEFVQSIKSEGVELEYSKMGRGTGAKTPPVIVIDEDDKTKDLDKLDIEIPILSPRVMREYKNFSDININDLEKYGFKPLAVKQFSNEEQAQITFRRIADDEVSHITELPKAIITDGTSAVGYFSQTIMHDLRLVSGYDVLYGKIKDFISGKLFGQTVGFDDKNILRNLQEVEARRMIVEAFKKAINDLTVVDKGETMIAKKIQVRNTRPFVVTPQEVLVPKKSVFNKIIGDSHLELEFAAFLEKCDDVVSYVKNYFAVGFSIDYQNSDGEISKYYPDFIVKTVSGDIWIVETKGLQDLDVAPKRRRLQQWITDINQLQDRTKFHELFVDEKEFNDYKAKSFSELVGAFTKDDENKNEQQPGK